MGLDQNFDDSKYKSKSESNIIKILSKNIIFKNRL